MKLFLFVEIKLQLVLKLIFSSGSRRSKLSRHQGLIERMRWVQRESQHKVIDTIDTDLAHKAHNDVYNMDDTKEFIVNVVANTLRVIIIKKKLENYTFKVCAFFCHLYIMASTNILSTEILNGMVHFHIIS